MDGPLGGASGGLRLALAGGGTGGHVVPGRNLLEHLAAAGRLDHVLWFGSGRAAEERALAGWRLGDVAGEGDVAGKRHGRGIGPAAVEHVVLPVERQGAPSRISSAMRLGPAVLVARRHLQRARSRVLLGLGGFASAPAVLAARSLGLPVLLLEVNAVDGLATRLLAPFSRGVFHSGGLGTKRGARHRSIDPILSPAFLAPLADRARARAAREALGMDPDRPLLVVLGGSQGARALNRFTAAHAAHFVAQGLAVLHQVGPGRMDEAAAGLDRDHYRPVEYLSDVVTALDGATGALVRAGASTLAEVVARAVPAVVVPYPQAALDHQRRNAESLGDAVWTVEEQRLGPAFAEELTRWLGPAGEPDRAERSERLRRRPRRGGAEALVTALLDAARAPARPSKTPAPARGAALP